MNSEGNILEKYMKEWLMSNDTLTIPHFGTFHTQYQSATVQAGVHKITPPNKLLGFDATQKDDDGELLSFLVQNKHLELDDAASLIKEYVLFVQEDLVNKKKYVAYGLGTWFLRPDNTIIFQTEEDTNLSAESFGLGTVYTAPLNKATMPQNIVEDAEESVRNDFEKEEKIKQKEEENQAKKPKTTRGFDENDPEFYDDDDQDDDDIITEEEIIERNKRKKYTLAALFLLLIFVGIGFTLMFFPEVFGTKKKQTVAEKKKEITEPEITEEPEEKIDSTANEKNTAEKAGKDDKNKKTETAEQRKKRLEARKKKIEELPDVSNKDLEKSAGDNPNPPKNLKDIEVKNKGNKFYVIVASFDTAPKAYTYINHLQKKGFNNLKLIKGTSNRVSIGEFNSTNEAQKRKAEISKKYTLESWVLKH